MRLPLALVRREKLTSGQAPSRNPERWKEKARSSNPPCVAGNYARHGFEGQASKSRAGLRVTPACSAFRPALESCSAVVFRATKEWPGLRALACLVSESKAPVGCLAL